MAVTEQQVKIYMSQRENGKTQLAAAAKAGVSERTARRLERGEWGRSRRPRPWRTREDPFAEVWSELAERLQAEPELQALTLLEWLQERHPGHYPDKLLRTLQRRVKAWRARYGPDKEVMFPQVYGPGERALSDFTALEKGRVTIAGEPLDHRLFHFRLAYSGWSHLRVVLGGESYSALAEGVVEALERLGGVPREHRTDSLSAAFKNLDAAVERDLTERYEALCAHYGMRASRNNPGCAHENGAIESPNRHIKRRLRQRLAMRGSSDFETLEDYRAFIEEVAASHNRRNASRIAAERAALAPLPCRRGVDYAEAVVRVTRSSTICYRQVLYSVPSRLIGERVRIHAYDDRLELFYGGTHVLSLPRLHRRRDGRRRRHIDYRHVITWLARKPRALAGLAFRDELLPDAAWRAIYQRLSQRLSTVDACKRVVAALQLAAEHDCTEELGRHWLDALEHGHCPSLGELQGRFRAGPPLEPPLLSVRQHRLADYDALLREVADE